MPVDSPHAQSPVPATSLVTDVSDIADVQLVAGTRSGAPASASSATVSEALAQPLVVTATNDLPDSNIGNGICRTANNDCSLRAAMHEANVSVGPDVINFNIPGGGVQTIHLVNPLPTISDGGLTINGYTQPGAQPTPIRRSATPSSPSRSKATVRRSAILPASTHSGSRRAATESRVWRCSTCSTRSSLTGPGATTTRSQATSSAPMPQPRSLPRRERRKAARASRWSAVRTTTASALPPWPIEM